MWLKSTIKFWPELWKEFRVWWIFKKTANENLESLNKDHKLRVDWLGRIYGVINLPEEVQGAANEIQQAYVLQQISKFGDKMLKMGLADVVYPEIQKIKGSAGYLVILWPVFDTLALVGIIKGLFMNSIFGGLIYLLIRLATKNSDAISQAWDWTVALF